MWPLEHPVGAGHSERTVAIDFGRQRAQRESHFIGLQAPRQADGAEVMAVEPLGQAAEDRMIGVGRDAVDDQLAQSDSEHQDRPRLEQPPGSTRDGGGGGLQRRVPARVHCMLLHGNGELHQEFAQVA